MSLPRKTIPYAAIDGNRERPFTIELELASIYILADAQRGSRKLSAISLAHYPFQLRFWNGALVIIDMLGLNDLKFRYNIVPDTETYQKKLDAQIEYPQACLNLLKEGREIFENYQEWETLSVKGLVSRPGKPEEVEALIQSAQGLTDFNEAIFQSTLTNRDVKAIFNQLDNIGKDIEKDVKTLTKAKSELEKSLDIVMKILDEELANIKDSSIKNVTQLETKINKKKARLERALKKDLEKMKSSFTKKVRPLREERTKRKRRLTRMETRLKRLKDKDDSKAIRKQKKDLDDLMKRLDEMQKAIKELEAVHKDEVKEVRSKVTSEISVEEKTLKEKKSQSQKEIQSCLDLRADIQREADVLSRKIDSLIKKKKVRTESLSRVQINLSTEEAEFYIPFYIFRFDEKQFNLHPPVIVGESQGLFNRLRRMLAENLEGKMNTLIKPRGLFLNPHLERAVKTLNKKGELSEIYHGREEKLNVFRSRRAMALIMKGIVEMRREGWINDGEYIRLQVGLVERLGEVTQP